MQNIKHLHFLQTARSRRDNMCYKTPLTNQELKSIGYRESMFNDYLYKFYGNYDAIVIDNETREVSHPYGTPEECLKELKILKNN